MWRGTSSGVRIAGFVIYANSIQHWDPPFEREFIEREVANQIVASRAEGAITVVQSDAAWLDGGGTVWKNTELPEILKRGKVTEATFLDLDGNVRGIHSFEERQISQQLKYISLPGG